MMHRYSSGIGRDKTPHDTRDTQDKMYTRDTWDTPDKMYTRDTRDTRDKLTKLPACYFSQSSVWNVPSLSIR